MVRELDSLKEQLRAEQQAKAKLTSEAQAKEERLRRFEAKEAQEREAWAKSQMGKWEEYLKGEEELNGPMSDVQKKAMQTVFTDPAYKDEASRFYARHAKAVELAASKRKADEEIATLKAEKVKLTDLMSRTAQSIGGMRASYAQALSAPTSGAEVTATKAVGVEASSLRLSDMMEPGYAPNRVSREDMSILAEFGYTNEVSVSASGNNNGGGAEWGQRPLPKSVEIAPEHPLLYDNRGEKNYPFSMRELYPAHFGMMVHNTNLRNDNLDSLVSIDPLRSGILAEHRIDGMDSHVLGGGGGGPK